MFNNIVLFQNSINFHCFYENGQECYHSVKNDREKNKRDIVFTTVIENIKLAFSVNEIRELWYLLESAHLESKNYV
ncbi:hypothetical protein GCM10007940_15490 [Portibacter lacus]|uniref:Uncharacterized protein n=2 Tax=Portibacter lacus TaxID=1099794 RepID=A0AA37WEQ5_9BACT|nr:hypothetical protein GCM10007940_15490 [Portibacter lacus]